MNDKKTILVAESKTADYSGEDIIAAVRKSANRLFLALVVADSYAIGQISDDLNKHIRVLADGNAFIDHWKKYKRITVESHRWTNIARNQGGFASDPHQELAAFAVALGTKLPKARSAQTIDTEEMRNAAKAIFLSVEEEVAEDLSALLIHAADEIDRLRAIAAAYA